ncbi:MAG: hypothetical protein K2I00_10975 [Ruminococcus sp.]|nr:hypothetical protein [Ruminococcus sp.]
MSKSYITVFSNINGELRRRDVSQEEFCRELEVERRTYMAWQKKNEMPFSFFLKCISYFGCSADYLLRDIVNTEKENAELKKVQQRMALSLKTVLEKFCNDFQLYDENIEKVLSSLVIQEE